ncbi:hypothetical protein D3C75_1038210 [compost metagenome]
MAPFYGLLDGDGDVRPSPTEDWHLITQCSHVVFRDLYWIPSEFSVGGPKVDFADPILIFCLLQLLMQLTQGHANFCLPH